MVTEIRAPLAPVRGKNRIDWLMIKLTSRFQPAVDGRAAHADRRRLLLSGCCGVVAGFFAIETQNSLAQSAPTAVLLAQDFKVGTDPTPYLVSEKLDGVRAVWDGKVLRFRSGRVIQAPAWFLAKLPPTPLDGELWLARGQFDVLSGMVRKVEPTDADWARILYMVFELPGGTGGFTQRHQTLRALVQSVGWPQLQVVEQFSLTSEAALKDMLVAVTRSGGEGLVLHLSDAPYQTGRSAVLLKLKTQQDAEAVVVGHVPGQGKYRGMLGALQVQIDGAKVFKLGTGLSAQERRNPPAVGSTVTFTYRGTSPQGVPRFAAFLRVAPEH